jgi:hypothetical protein
MKGEREQIFLFMLTLNNFTVRIYTNPKSSAVFHAFFNGIKLIYNNTKIVISFI